MKILLQMNNVKQIADAANGDARKALTLLESTVFASSEEDGVTIVEDSTIEKLSSIVLVFSGIKKVLIFTTCLSALQKSVRGSDTDAALYYLAHLT